MTPPSFNPFSLTYQTFIHAFLIHTFIYTHSLAHDFVPTPSFSSFLFQSQYSRLFPGCKPQLLHVRHASSLSYRHSTHDILCFFNSLLNPVKFVHVFLLPLHLCFWIITISFPFLILSQHLAFLKLTHCTSSLHQLL